MYDQDDVEGEYVMGDESDDSVVGYVMGAGAPRRGQMVRVPKAPPWRRRAAAPGVQLPGEGLEPLPMTPKTSGGIFTSAAAGEIIIYTGKVQRPFAPERLLLGVARVADPIAGVPVQRIVTDTLFFGTSLGQLQRGDVDLELLGAPTAFGVRMRQTPVAPGIEIEVPVRLLGPALVDAQAVIVTMIWLGRSIQ